MASGIIFVFHYMLFSLGLTSVLILLTLFLQTYSDASLTEIGSLLMVLPFISIIAKPLFCALADRQQAHKAYLIGSLLFMALGYGSLTIAPFYPEIIEQHGRLIWYLDVVGVTIGFTAFGVAFSIGDALAVNAARVNNIPWGTYRVWSTVAWGLGGAIVGVINETPLLPKYVPALFLLVGALVFESLLLFVWPNRVFDMTEGNELEPSEEIKPQGDKAGELKNEDLELNDLNWPSNKSLAGTLSGSARLNPRLMGAMATVFMEDLGSSLRGGTKKRNTLTEVLEQHKLNGGLDSARPSIAPSPVVGPLKAHPATALAALSSSPRPSQSAAGSMGKGAWLRTQRALSRMNSLSSASGHAFANELSDTPSAFNSPQTDRRQQRIMGSMAGSNSLSRAAAARALELAAGGGKQSVELPQLSLGSQLAATETAQDTDQFVQDLQLALFKLVVRRNLDIIKYLILFTLIGVLFNAHLAYFFIHVQQLCQEKGFDFSSVMGALTVAHSVSEVISFVFVVPYYMPIVGRFGSMLTPIVIFFLRYLFYATYYVEMSPWYALITEFGHGFGYGITYSLITEIATECVDQVDQYLPELIERGIVPPSINPNALKLPLRATMYGVFSGAFDGLGNGLGSLLGGIYLDAHPFTSLWLCCTYLAGAIAILYPITEWRLLCGSKQTVKQ